MPIPFAAIGAASSAIKATGIGRLFGRRKRRRDKRRAAQAANIAAAEARGVDPFNIRNATGATTAMAGGFPKLTPGLLNVLRGAGQRAGGFIKKNPLTVPLAAAAAGTAGNLVADDPWAQIFGNKPTPNGTMASNPMPGFTGEDPTQALLLMMMAKKSGRGRKTVPMPIHGLYADTIIYTAPDGSIKRGSPDGYLLVDTPGGPVSVYGPFARSMGWVPKPRQRAKLTAAEYRGIKRLDTKKKSITKLARDIGCMPTQRRRRTK